MPNFGPPTTNTGNAAESSESRFLELESTLEMFQVTSSFNFLFIQFDFQENARHIGIIVSDFSPKSQDILNQKIHTMISGLQVNLFS